MAMGWVGLIGEGWMGAERVWLFGEFRLAKGREGGRDEGDSEMTFVRLDFLCDVFSSFSSFFFPFSSMSLSQSH